nr:aminotransferase class V-fold PLP-dependent enzyme [Thioalkalivibrio sp. XN279]
MELAALQVLRSGQIAAGPKVAQFELEFSRLVNRPHVVSTSDMTSAMILALHLAGVGPGDDVLTQAFSCLASTAPIARLGARAVWVDIDATNAAISPDDLKRAITPRTRAVMVYHIAGYPAPMEEIVTVCRERGIAVIEDCNAALGATSAGEPVGRLGDYAVYSLYPNRQINAIEGGILVCPNAETAARATRLRRFGIDASSFRDSLGEIDPQCDVEEIGWSSALNQLSAAVALEQLSSLGARQERTRDVAHHILRECSNMQGAKPVVARRGTVPAYWTFLFLADRRDQAILELQSRGLQATRLHQRNDVYSGFDALRRALPGTDSFMSQVLAVPCGWWIDESQSIQMTNTLQAVFGH